MTLLLCIRWIFHAAWNMTNRWEWIPPLLTRLRGAGVSLLPRLWRGQPDVYCWPPISAADQTWVSEWVLSKFNGTSTPKGSYRAETSDNDSNVNSSRYGLRTALCESIRYQAKSEQNVRQDLIPRGAMWRLLSCTPQTRVTSPPPTWVTSPPPPFLTAWTQSFLSGLSLAMT